MRTSLITLFLFYILSQMNAQYVIEEWNVSALNQDSLLKRKIMYDSLNRPIQCIMFGKEDVTINYVYSDSSSKLVYENWNTVEKGNYLTYETKYDSFNRPYEIFETLDGIRSLTKKYIYKSNDEYVLKKFAEGDLTDVETTFKLINGKISETTIKWGTVYGKKQAKEIWIIDKYEYDENGLLVLIESKQADNISKYVYYYSAEKILNKTEFYEQEEGKFKLISITYYIRKIEK